MGEFVEHSLECLLSTFEQIAELQLFTSEELNIFIKRCRQYEYRLNKHEKTPRDFNLYAEYLCDFLTLLKSRRIRMQYWHKKKLIDQPLRKKVASIYRRAADRFQGVWEQWERLIKFLKENKMYRELSAAYTRALQIYGKDENLRKEFALWQFFEAASPQNARTQILAALRVFPQSASLYAAFFAIEIHFVDKVLKRRKFITEDKERRGTEPEENDLERVYDGEIEDAIMNLDVAKVVIEQALSSVPSHDAAGMLVEMWKECNKVELVPNIEKVRSFIVDELNKYDNEETRLFEIELANSGGTSKFEAFDEALKKTPTEKMHRLYLKWLREMPTDAFVESKIRAVLHDLCDNGWVKDKDWFDIEKEIEFIEEEYGMEFIKKCLEKRPQSAVIWNIYLEKCLEEGTMSSDEFREACNRALDKVDYNDSFPIWQRAIEYSIMYAPNETEQVFKDAMMNTNTSIKSKIKILYLDYLDELLDQSMITANKLRERVVELVNDKPNSAEFYCVLHQKELARPQPDHKFAGFVIKSAVNEQDCASVEAVILYAKWCLTHEPTRFHVVHQMGLKLFEGALLDEFLVSWTQLVQSAAEDIREQEVDGMCEKEEVKALEEDVKIQTDEMKVETMTSEEMEHNCKCTCEDAKIPKNNRKRRRRNSRIITSS